MDLSKNIPSYLVNKKNIVRLILFTSLFALVFINIYSPFGVTTKFSITKLELLMYSSLIILTGVMVVVISRIIMYHVAKRGKPVSLGRYLIWIGVEIVSMSLFYTLYELFILEDPRSFAGAFKVSALNTSLVLLIPYSTAWLYFAWIDNKEKLEAIARGEEGIKEKKGMIMFKDEKGILRFSIKEDDLLYLRGAENYVTVFYSNQDKQEKFLLRNTLKNLEESLKPLDIIRCHRSYMVNLHKVKLIERERDGFKLRLNTMPQVELPVSKTYTGIVFSLFGQN